MERKKVEDLKELVDYAAETYGDKAAYKYKKKKDVITKSFSEVKQDSDAFGRTLVKYGLNEKHIAVIGPTSPEWVCAYLGTVNSGSVVVPIDKELPAEDVCELINRADVCALVFDSKYEDVARKVKDNCPAVERYFNMQAQSHNDFSLSLQQCFAENRGTLDTVIDRDKLCTIMFTSGTTGKSKGVMLCHRNIADNVTCTDMGIDSDAVTLSALPIHHAYCFTCEILLGLYLGITVCINDSVMHFAKNLQFFKPSILVVVPLIAESMYNKLQDAMKAAPFLPKKLIVNKGFGGNLKTIYSGGAYLNPNLITKFQEVGITLVQGYGMSECSPLISTNYVNCSKPDSVGKLVPGCQCKIVDDEIWVKSSSVMMGYYKNKEATAETLEDGWLKTGDLGKLDDDGFLYITGRKKNLIILSNGENVSPEELENKLSPNPLVAEVLVYEKDNVITAEIYPNMDYAGHKRIKNVPEELQKLLDEVNMELPVFKRIHGLVIRNEEFEKTTSRKIKRKY